MRFPEKYIKHGKFKLHSGETSNILYDVNALLTDYNEWIKIRELIPYHYRTYVGIVTGGAIIASQFNQIDNYHYNWAMIKDGELKGEIKGTFCLVDDVCTTETLVDILIIFL
jgi:orotate phosphoribosyltransferase